MDEEFKNQNILGRDIVDEMQESYLSYASMSRSFLTYNIITYINIKYTYLNLVYFRNKSIYIT